MLKVVSNSSPLIHLSKIRRLDLLKNFFRELLIPEAVYRECVIEGYGREDSKEIEEAKWIKVRKIKNVDLKRAFMMILDEGESEAILLSLEEKADLLLLDEYDAREVARNFNLNLTGVIGILIKAENEGLIDDLEKELVKLRETGFWISNDLYAGILKERRKRR